jgi:hypothetical protein
MPCDACSHGPSGIEGHQDLLVQAIGGYRIMLKCRRCDSLWSRAQPAQSRFEWTRITAQMARFATQGIAVPPRSGTWTT